MQKYQVIMDLMSYKNENKEASKVKLSLVGFFFLSRIVRENVIYMSYNWIELADI